MGFLGMILSSSHPVFGIFGVDERLSDKSRLAGLGRLGKNKKASLLKIGSEYHWLRIYKLASLAQETLIVELKEDIQNYGDFLDEVIAGQKEKDSKIIVLHEVRSFSNHSAYVWQPKIIVPGFLLKAQPKALNNIF
jgi:hypothetical protein